MNDLALISEHFSVNEAIREIANASHLWLQDTSLQNSARPYEKTTSVGLRVAVPVPHQPQYDTLDSAQTSNWALLPAAAAIATTLAQHRNQWLGRVSLLAIVPLSRVLPHRLDGAYYRAHDRYHVILQPSQCKRFAGNDSTEPAAGECWWVNTQSMHGAHNYGDAWHIDLVVDLVKAARVPTP